MPSPDLVVRSRRVALPEGVRPAAVHVAEGRIERIVGYNELPGGRSVVEVDDALVMPGLVDTHVHVNEPGRADWEGFETATQAAAAGGVTTLLDMPLNSIPATVTAEALHIKMEAARGKLWADVGFLGGVVPGNRAHLRELWESGVCAFKCFMIDSGVPEFPPVQESDLHAALAELQKIKAPLLAHAELPGPIQSASTEFEALHPLRRREYDVYLRSRPPEAELEAIDLLLRLCRQYKAPVHVVHLATALAADRLAAARAEGLPVTVETCPHYLFFASPEVPAGATEFKCAPPVRSAADRDGLWEALARGVVDMVVSDHSPCPPSMKACESGDFKEAWGGIASLQLALGAVWTQARQRGHQPETLARWMCQEPARLAGLAHRKGRIQTGFDADLVIWEPEAAWTVAPETLRHRHKLTPYAGQKLYGRVRKTILRGRVAFDDGQVSALPHGEIVRRTG